MSFKSHLRWVGVCLLLIGLAVPLLATPRAVGDVSREVRMVGSGVSGRVTLEARPDAAACPGLPPRTVSAVAPGKAVIGLSGCQSWRLSCLGRVFCAANIDRDAEGASTLTLFPAARVRGRLQAPRTHGLPESILVSGRLRDQGDTAKVDFDFEVPAEDQGGFVFRAPDGPLDLRIAAKDLAPAYRWNVRPKEGILELGVLKMVSGGSILGYVVDGDTGYPVASATVSATAAGLDGLPIADQEAATSLPAPSARTNDRGAFQLKSLAPGAYRLKAEHPDFLTVEPPGIGVVRNAETILGGDIALSKPLALRILIDPLASPDGSPWEVALADPATSTDVANVTADLEGSAIFDRLAPASLRMRIGTQDVFNAFEEEIELTGDRDMAVEIPIVEVVGRVTLDDEPVQGKIDIGTGAGDRWAAPLDEDGGFATWIREPAHNILFLAIEGESFTNPTQVVVREPVVRKGRIDLEIELLDLEISGRVITQRGTPVKDAFVIARLADHMFTKVYSDEDGAFSMRPLQASEYRLKASWKGYGDSAEELVSLDESLPSVETELVLRRNRRLKGLVSGPSGEAVGGARVVTFSAGQDWVEDTVGTDANGRFRAEVAADAQRAVVLIEALGYPLWSACIDSTREAVIQLPAASGHLEIGFVPREDSAPHVGQNLLVNADGGMVPMNEVLRWVRQNGGVWAKGPGELLQIPNVAPGRWAILRTALPWAEKIAGACSSSLLQGSSWETVHPGETASFLLDMSGVSTPANETN